MIEKPQHIVSFLYLSVSLKIEWKLGSLLFLWEKTQRFCQMFMRVSIFMSPEIEEPFLWSIPFDKKSWTLLKGNILKKQFVFRKVRKKRRAIKIFPILPSCLRELNDSERRQCVLMEGGKGFIRSFRWGALYLFATSVVGKADSKSSPTSSQRLPNILPIFLSIFRNI